MTRIAHVERPQQTVTVLTKTDDHLWAWASMAYGRGAAKTVLIDVQDRFGVHVNIILWCAWCGAAGQALQRVEILNAVEIANQWSGHVTAALRDARRGVRAMPERFRAHAADSLYGDIIAIELAAERLELGMLAKLVASNAPVMAFVQHPVETAFLSSLQGQAIDIARRNVMAYLAEINAVRVHGFSVTPVERVLQEIFHGT
ncbi:MAG: TIGR02444 family protein [Pseudomonadota bacterium]